MYIYIKWWILGAQKKSLSAVVEVWDYSRSLWQHWLIYPSSVQCCVQLGWQHIHWSAYRQWQIHMCWICHPENAGPECWGPLCLCDPNGSTGRAGQLTSRNNGFVWDGGDLSLTLLSPLWHNYMLIISHMVLYWSQVHTCRGIWWHTSIAISNVHSPVINTMLKI